MKRVMEKALLLRNNINTKTQYNDYDITSGVQRLLTDDRNVFIPQFQLIDNIEDCEVSIDILNEFDILEYLQFNAGAYIPTNIKRNGETKFQVDLEFQVVTISNGIFFYMGLEALANVGTGTALGVHNSKFNFIEPGNNWREFTNANTNNNSVSVLYNGNDVTISGSLSYNVSNANFGTSAAWNAYSLCFGNPTAGTVPYIFRGSSVYINDVLIETFYPAKSKKSNTYGLLNQNNKFYAGSGSFTPGPIISGGE